MDFFEGIIKGIGNVFKSVINGMIINPINWAIKGINDLIRGVNKIPGVNIDTLSKIPSLDIGTNRVMSDGLAMIHAGEAIVPAAEVQAGGFSGMSNNNKMNIGTINIEAIGFEDKDELVGAIGDQLNVFLGERLALNG